MLAEKKWKEHLDAKTQTKAIKTFDDYQRFFNRGAVITSVGGIFWLYSIFDAYWERPVKKVWARKNWEVNISLTQVEFTLKY